MWTDAHVFLPNCAFYLIEHPSLRISVHVHAAQEATLNICGGCSCEAGARGRLSPAKYLIGLSDGRNRL